MSDNKTHPATPKKLADARKRGEVPRSADIPQTASFVAATAALFALGSFLFDRLAYLFEYARRVVRDPALLERWELHLEAAITALVVLSLPVLAVAFLGALIGGLGQSSRSSIRRPT
jgi:type III secretion protein U